MKSRIAQSNPEDTLKGKLTASLYNEKSEYSRIFYYAQVISNNDPKKLNRIKVRIPILDDGFYNGVSKDEGDSKLPWCLPFSKNFIETPETNTIIVVAIFDPKIPYFGRMWFDTMTQIDNIDLLEKLTPEKTQNGWYNADNSLLITNPKPTKLNEYEVANRTVYTMGVRGKGQNKLEFTEDGTLLTQYHKDKQKESKLVLRSDTSILEAADRLDVLSKKGDKNKYNVIFDKKMFEYLDSVNKMFNKIITLLNTIPAISPVGPCMPAKNAPQLVNQFSSLKADLKRLKKEGSSKKIFIN